MRIGLLNGGGDCPGLNAVTHGVVGAASTLGWEVVGFRDSFEGLLPPGDFKILDLEKTRGILKLGGTILGTTNRGLFSSKLGEGQVAKIPSDLMDQARSTLASLEIEALICVGGDGTLATALQFHEEGTPIIGVPKTIDNDLKATAVTFGFNSATQSVVDSLDRLQTTASSHKRVFVLEVMGRHAGWIALHGGIGGGANAILIPEIPFDIEKVADVIRLREAAGLHSSLIVVAEGAAPVGGSQVIEEPRSKFRSETLTNGSTNETLNIAI
jgi:6-phosphofructokinase